MKQIDRILGPRTKEGTDILDPRIPRETSSKTQGGTEQVAEYLVAKYKSPSFRPVFLKAAWRISEARLMQIVEASFGDGVRNPRAYFISAVKSERSYRG